MKFFLEFITLNPNIFSTISASVVGFLGWLVGRRSRKIDLQRKFIQMNAEMIDSIKKDFDDRISNLKGHIDDLIEINEDLEKIIKNYKNKIENFRKNEKVNISS